MSPELLSLIGGGASGFIFSLIGKLVDMADRAHARTVEAQKTADESADRASKRAPSGVVVRRFIVVLVLFAVIVAPFINAHTEVGNVVEQQARGGLIGFIQGIFGFGRASGEVVQGYVILPEVRQTLLAIVGFYFGSSQMR